MQHEGAGPLCQLPPADISHTRWGPEVLLWCRKCGGYAESRAVKLAQPRCQPTSWGKCALTKIATGFHPQRDVVLCDQWDLTQAKSSQSRGEDTQGWQEEPCQSPSTAWAAVMDEAADQASRNSGAVAMDQATAQAGSQNAAAPPAAATVGPAAPPLQHRMCHLLVITCTFGRTTSQFAGPPCNAWQPC